MSCIAKCSICKCLYVASEPTEDGVCIACLLEACDKGPEMGEEEEVTA